VRDASMSEDKPLHWDGVNKVIVSHHPRLCHGCRETIPVGDRYRRWQTFAEPAASWTASSSTTCSKDTSWSAPALLTRPALWVRADWYQREVVPVVGAYVQLTLHDDRPDPRGSAVGGAIGAEGRDVHVVGRSDGGQCR
jgi:hypothetical protein